MAVNLKVNNFSGIPNNLNWLIQNKMKILTEELGTHQLLPEHDNNQENIDPKIVSIWQNKSCWH